MASAPQEELTLLLTIGTLGILCLTVSIVLFFFVYQKRILALRQHQQKIEAEFQQEMILALLKNQEHERKRLASDLHDSINSLLWAAKVNVTFLQRTLVMEGDARESFQELNDVLDQTIHTVRRIAWELTPEAFHHSGLSQSLSSLCERIDGKGMKVTFRQEGSRLWNDDNALQVFRIVQELVSNSLKHAHANTLDVTLTWLSEQLVVEVVDDGKGFTLEEERAGVGWWNIQQRARQVQAEITMGKSPMDKGVRVTLTIPLPHEA